MNERLLTGLLVLALGACAQQHTALHYQGDSSAEVAMNGSPALSLNGVCPAGETVHLTREQSGQTVGSLASFNPATTEIRCGDH